MSLRRDVMSGIETKSVILRVGASVLILLLLTAAGCATPVQSAASGSEAAHNEHSEHTITVQGQGEASSEPDTASFTVGYTAIAETTKEAQDTVNRNIGTVLAVMKEFGVQEEDISTQGLQITPEYEWTDDGRKLVGQRVRQTLEVKVRSIDADTDSLSAILDRLGSIQGVEVSSMRFSVEQTDALYTAARERAYGKAKQKADELAELSGMVLLHPLSMTENSRDIADEPMAEMAVRSDAAALGAPKTAVPSGKISVTVSVSIVFAAEPPAEPEAE